MATINAIGSSLPIEVSKGGTGVVSPNNHSLLVGSGSSPIASVPVGLNGQVLLGSSAANPVFATLTSTGGTIAFTPGAGSLNLEAMVDLTPWNEVTAASVALLVNEGYIINFPTAVTATLPVVAALGTVINVAGKGAGLVVIAQNALQQIHFGSVSTTIGVGGSIIATNLHDCVQLLCVVANKEWEVIGSIGNWNII